jgi:hypothetical protein
MRTAFVSLIALASVATGALAQEAAAPAAPAAPATTEAPAAPAAPDAAAPAAPAPEAAAPAAPAEPPPPPPKLPTSGDGAEVLSFLERVCVPAVAGQGKLEDLAKAAGMKKDRKSGGAIMQLGTTNKAYTITVLPAGANPNVCWAEIHYATGQSLPIVAGLNIWSYLHQPELKPQRRDYSTDATNKRVTSSWEHYTDKESTGLVFVELFKPDGASLNGKYDTATLQYSQRKF